MHLCTCDDLTCPEDVEQKILEDESTQRSSQNVLKYQIVRYACLPETPQVHQQDYLDVPEVKTCRILSYKSWFLRRHCVFLCDVSFLDLRIFYLISFLRKIFDDFLRHHHH